MKGKSTEAILMAKINRKVIPAGFAGKSCHMDIHRGTYNGTKLTTLLNEETEPTTERKSENEIPG